MISHHVTGEQDEHGVTRLTDFGMYICQVQGILSLYAGVSLCHNVMQDSVFKTSSRS